MADDCEARVAEAYFRGAIMAWAERLATNLPAEIKFLEPQFAELAQSFRRKAENAEILAAEGGEA